MMKKISWMSAALAAFGIVGTTSVAFASSHREAPQISQDPAADNTDLYAWVQGGNLVILANYNPLEEPAGGPNFNHFSDDVLYEVHIARGPSSLNDVLTYQIRFQLNAFPQVDPADLAAPLGGGKEFFYQLSGQSQTYSVTKLVNGGMPTTLVSGAKVAPANIGPRTNQVAYGIPMGTTYEGWFVDNPGMANVMASLGMGQGRAFAGPRDDGFSVDLGAIFDLAGLEPVMMVPAPFDNVAGYNVHTIALEIPLAVANGGMVNPGPSDAQTIGVWASASRQKVTILRKNGPPDMLGPWIQVSRLGLPLINEVVIGLQDKDKYNRTHPRDDVTNFGAYFLNPILVRDAEAVGFYAAGGPLAGCLGGGGINALKQNRTDIIDVINLKPNHNITAIGDVLRVDLGTSSAFPNGRKVNPGMNTEEDVTDTELTLILCALVAPVSDGAPANDATFKATFPYLAPPWEGSRQGKGE